MPQSAAGDATGAAGVGADAGRRHPVRDRNCCARRRAAGDAAARTVIGRGRRAVMRVEAEPGEGELAHIGAAHDDEAGTAQARDRGGVALGRRCVGEHDRACRRRFAGEVEQVLHRDRNAGEGRGAEPCGPQFVHRFGCGARGLAMDLDEGEPALAVRRLDPVERFADEGERARPSRGEIVGEAGKGRHHDGVRPGRNNGFRAGCSPSRT
jgi:hypothetical protein